MPKNATDILEAEHVFILKVVAAMVAMTEKLEKGGDVSPDTLRRTVEFLRTYADKFHHGKEEAHLFTLLEKKGVPTTGCPLAALMFEHKSGRSLVGKFAEAVESYAKDPQAGRVGLAASMKPLATLYPNHIWKEDYLLSPMTGKVLNAAEQKILLEKFIAVEKELGEETHREWERFAEELGNMV
ncbi:MAG: hemerythrin domain-containing protein [Elusimicrobia bacterium]|nr:hemerythrin domain-containing protein [Elusimicrobiota bacterium]MBK7208692.1 hemerythrin domain-containing protein [Elusimicrobiota bacterium]MBK7545434.1 hemerythrin domain-containing protein [Elusimicrobiota bacterium]MBK7575549.1 hemerythrin domain-containing protein [Elusimicrobiota bacterium]MBK7688457.1 hemerythrin domain-containing protein [Elusimicrobiota bacterium]